MASFFRNGRKCIAIGRNYVDHAKELGNAVPKGECGARARKRVLGKAAVDWSGLGGRTRKDILLRGEA